MGTYAPASLWGHFHPTSKKVQAISTQYWQNDNMEYDRIGLIDFKNKFTQVLHNLYPTSDIQLDWFCKEVELSVDFNDSGHL
jgi:hypothetical protein